MKAVLRNYRQSPRKVRLVASLLKGKSVRTALLNADVLTKRAALPIKKLILSAVANAKQKGFNQDTLVIESIRVDKGLVMKRYMPKAFGRASGVKKFASHVVVTLKEGTFKAKKVRATREKKKEETKETA